MKQSSKSVILSDQRESKDLRIIDTARILRFAALTQDDKERNILRFHMGFSANTAMPTVRAINDRPYSMGHTGLEAVGRGLGPAGKNIYRNGGSKPPPYSMERTVFEIAGGGDNGNCVAQRQELW